MDGDRTNVVGQNPLRASDIAQGGWVGPTRVEYSRLILGGPAPVALEFEWDPWKAERNAEKHGVSFEEAKTVFGDPLGRITTDSRHAINEERYVLLGVSQARRLLAVMFCERAEAIRVISARRATARERREYEEAF